ncbi:restriction endonuclease subunit S [Lautropia mirabilis]
MINRSFPSNWTVATLGEISFYIQRGKSPKYVESSPLAVINQKCIRWNQLQTEHQKYIHPEQIPTWDANRHIRQGDILWNSTGTGTVGRAYLVKSIDCQPPKVVDSHVTIVRSNPEVDSRIIFYWIKGPNVQNRIEELCDGSTNQVELSRTTISEIKIPLPPINEQRRIADKLDRVLARVDAANEHLSCVAPLIKRFRQSVLAAATSGRLTEDWREQNTIKLTETSSEIDSFRTSQLPELPHSWSWKPFSSIARVSSNLQDPSEHTDSIHLAPNHVESWTGRIYSVRTIAEDGVTSPKHKFNAGQIVYSKIRPNLCKVAIPNFSGLCSADMYPIDTDIHVHYLAYWMRSQKFTDWASNAESRTVLPKINQAQLNTLPVPVPSSQEEQSEIIRRVEKLFAFADRLEERLSQAQTAVHKLTPALLAKAFRGELVPQDPNDEPASELLKRLQESRTKSAKPRRAHKPRVRKAP